MQSTWDLTEKKIDSSLIFIYLLMNPPISNQIPTNEKVAWGK